MTGADSAVPPLRGPPAGRPDAAFQSLPRSFYERSSVELARALLGTLLLRLTDRGLTAGIIVETEAYAGPADRASHARAGRTPRTAPMFGPAGHAYVYFIYGIHDCLNVVAGGPEEAGAVLVRALEPALGVEQMRMRRGRPPSEPQARLCAGPARLCQAMDVHRSLDGHDLTLGHDLWISAPAAEDASRIREAGVINGPRIGVSYAGPDWASRPWRFGVKGHPSLSRPFPGVRR